MYLVTPLRERAERKSGLNTLSRARFAIYVYALTVIEREKEEKKGGKERRERSAAYIYVREGNPYR